MISDIVYEQLVNLVNDNIKSEYVDFNNQRIPSVYSCSLTVRCDCRFTQSIYH
jgi:hypothetical protein